MARLVLSYERGDASAFAALFTEGATTTDADGRAAIQRLYGDFFATLEGSRFELDRLRWSSPGLVRDGSGQATILTRPRGGRANTVRLRMDFTVRREGGAVRISRMEYR